MAVMALAYFGLPHFARELPPMDMPVPVDVVTVADITNAPPPPAPKPEPEKQEPPKPEPVKAPPPPPPPPPEAAAPEPKPEPEPPKAIAEAPAPLPKPKTRPEPPLKDVKPERKPPPPDAMASILKSVEKLKQQRKEQTPVETAEALKNRTQPPREYNPAAPVSISQIDAIRRHFERCWNIPAGAREAENLAVDIRVALAPDATVQAAHIVEPARMATDAFYRAAAESALRAVLNPQCRSLQDVGLKAEQYDQWKDMVITFNPKQMIGA
jgi:outer membrane biosynthesis protein TonB